MENERAIHDGRKPRVWLWLSVAGVLMSLLVLVAVGMWHARQEADVARAFASISERGEPLAANELEAYYVIPPDAENVTKLWLDGSKSLAQPAYSQAVANVPIVGKSVDIPPPGQPWGDLPAAENLLAQYQSSLALLHEAAEAGGAARYPTTFKNGIAMLLPHVQDLRNAARLLVLEAHVKAHRGDPHGAAESIIAALAAGESLKNEPLLISQLVRFACHETARNTLQELLPHADLSDDDLVRLEETLRALDYRDGLRRGLIGERTMGTMALSDPQQLSGAGGGGGLQPVEFLFPLFSAGALQVYLGFMDQSLTAVERPWPQAIAEAERIEAELAANTEAAAIFSRMKYMLTNLIAASLNSAFKAAARNTAHNDATIAAIAIERYRRQHGEFPENLSQLVPELMKTVPMDPFNGQSLKYVPSEAGYVIYNVGQDGIDNGGRGDDTGKPDDVLQIEYPQATGEE